jgi:hypothetical protein
VLIQPFTQMFKFCITAITVASSALSIACRQDSATALTFQPNFSGADEARKVLGSVKSES